MARLRGINFSGFIQVSRYHLHMGKWKEGYWNSGRFAIMGGRGDRKLALKESVYMQFILFE